MKAIAILAVTAASVARGANIFAYCDLVQLKSEPNAPYGGIRFTQKPEDENLKINMLSYWYDITPGTTYKVMLSDIDASSQQLGEDI